MTPWMASRLGALWLFAMAAAIAPAQSAEAQTAATPTVQGLWRSGDTTIRISVSGSEARALFADVGQQARALGFKPAELSFVASVAGQYLHGVQTVRYGGSCFPAGREVAMMGRLAADGQTLTIHFYNILIAADCRDTGQDQVLLTSWERVPGP